jgi:hypothetical protein
MLRLQIGTLVAVGLSSRLAVRHNCILPRRMFYCILSGTHQLRNCPSDASTVKKPRLDLIFVAQHQSKSDMAPGAPYSSATTIAVPPR